jgi:hypothetical protein
MDTHLHTRGEDVPIEKRKVAGLTGLLQETLEICRTLPEGAFLWFRGLSRSQHELLPKIMRDGRTADEVFERELRLLTRFRQRSLAYWPEGYPQSDWEHLFAMQHFGLPTRLLDWSENLFVAAYFALMAPDGPIPADAGLPNVWCIDPVAWNRATRCCPDLAIQFTYLRPPMTRWRHTGRKPTDGETNLLWPCLVHTTRSG